MQQRDLKDIEEDQKEIDLLRKTPTESQLGRAVDEDDDLLVALREEAMSLAILMRTRMGFLRAYLRKRGYAEDLIDLSDLEKLCSNILASKDLVGLLNALYNGAWDGLPPKVLTPEARNIFFAINSRLLRKGGYRRKELTYLLSVASYFVLDLCNELDALTVYLASVRSIRSARKWRNQQ